jgi:hypothetical protein
VGVVETGLFVDFPVKAFFGGADGKVTTRSNTQFTSLVASSTATPAPAAATTSSRL